MDEKRPVIVECEGMNDNQTLIIKDVVDYYNKVFETINKNYKFKLKDDKTRVLGSDTVINIKNKELPKYTLGSMNAPKAAKDCGDGAVIIRSQIIMDWKQIQEYGDKEAYYVLLHVMGHALGLGDVYYQEDYRNHDCVDMTTIMQRGIYKDGLYPNDYAMLQALYSDEYKKHDDYAEAVKIVNERIRQYTNSVYYSFANNLKENYDACNLKIHELPTKLNWVGEHNKNAHLHYELEFKNNNRDCVFTITDKNGKFLEKCKGKVVEVNGIVFIRGLSFKDASNYNGAYDSDLSLKLLLTLSKDKEGYIIVRDPLYSYGDTLSKGRNVAR